MNLYLLSDMCDSQVYLPLSQGHEKDLVDFYLKVLNSVNFLQIFLLMNPQVIYIQKPRLKTAREKNKNIFFILD